MSNRQQKVERERRIRRKKIHMDNQIAVMQGTTKHSIMRASLYYQKMKSKKVMEKKQIYSKLHNHRINESTRLGRKFYPREGEEEKKRKKN